MSDQRAQTRDTLLAAYRLINREDALRAVRSVSLEDLMLAEVERTPGKISDVDRTSNLLQVLAEGLKQAGDTPFLDPVDNVYSEV